MSVTIVLYQVEDGTYWTVITSRKNPQPDFVIDDATIVATLLAFANRVDGKV